MAWPTITENVTKATKAFFESVFTQVETEVSTEKVRAEGAEATAGVIILGNEQTGNYTLKTTDAGKCVEYNKAATVGKITIPTFASQKIPVGAVITLTQVNTGPIEILAEGGVTLNSPNSVVSRTQYSIIAVRQRKENIWILSGDLA